MNDSPNSDTLETNTDSTRTLASIQRVVDVRPHPNADSLELVDVLGWQVCEKLGTVKKGDMVVYFEIDSMLPGNAKWLPEAVKKRIEKQADKSWYRIKTVKLRKEISQGLIIPLNLLHNARCPTLETDFHKLYVHIDVTDVLGVKKYEPPALTGLYLQNKTNNNVKFPTDLVQKTDEQRIQSNPALLERLNGLKYYATVKYDGTSGTYLINPDTGEFLVCSRNLIRKKPADLSQCPYWYAAHLHNIEEKLKRNPNLAIQGEICGPNIQKNLLNCKKLSFYVFDITDIKTQKKLPMDELIKTCKQLGLEMVDIEEVGDSFDNCSIKELLEKAKGKYKNTKNHREGLVFRAQDQSISFKVINNEYLLRQK